MKWERNEKEREGSKGRKEKEERGNKIKHEERNHKRRKGKDMRGERSLSPVPLSHQITTQLSCCILVQIVSWPQKTIRHHSCVSSHSIQQSSTETSETGQQTTLCQLEHTSCHFNTPSSSINTGTASPQGNAVTVILTLL